MDCSTQGLRGAIQSIKMHPQVMDAGSISISKSFALVPCSQSTVPEKRDMLIYTMVLMTDDQRPSYIPQRAFDSYGVLEIHKLFCEILSQLPLLEAV